MRAIVDSGPIIALSKVGLLDLLPVLFETIIVPEDVRNEVARAGETRPGFEIASLTCVQVMTVDSGARNGIEQTYDLDMGEAACLVLAGREEDAVLIIDDAKALAAAKQLGLPWIRTGKVLITAFEVSLLTMQEAERAIEHLYAEHYLGATARRDVLAMLRRAGRQQR
ncbi:hypothetical protein A3B21_01805 [Candidatus Uhrbacteria bacterium RIFCSPLOWO2_01_FULL_47_24]|uniref:DUF3368 domain-containing protein n=1 Tax=Candidatus Uhrbacteria bacterium RIFCSPLOWO2_01_FULL_47_24 TaxID=1802401 RepID=A0A1F7UPB8_9BACT|nr:MAG: hypothetical protein A2753_04180 [Candidatus Uhrbacteria bacterium RIFCSPHIGHO2_01_FULL_47_11]OGL67903.1 MAG: hypothetical protein A3D58_05000 [Candidatus Uhrbacteria bacterium RIFCSPHIGHO2_02_FULL_46_47]OGL75324.1 MAG: hypothetical protein A3F52_03040 [Candidatus Uhrbacteria bacterium RIFCSPHIGHO2_12_FULL_47_11]OGL80089.1 MAG: hypothetical protein A3B21_01805 [Candidatus Uhrbacteria bacterium RIFCSPLOWO2_01_FULL_47_24]OGL84875.1 MAG: hypothetical protein A3J03_04190 [Candidatus Uhrbact